MRSVLTIAGFDPSSGAGVTADLMVFAAHGLFGTSAITNLTVQSTVGVDSSHAVEPELVAMTLAFLDADLPPAGIKIGALGTAWVVEAVALYLEAVREAGGRVPVVLDPVIRSSAGEGHWLAGIRVETRATHGTGCALSSAVLSRVVLGDAPAVAAATAKRYVVEAMRRASPMGRGHGPMELLWPLRTHGG